VLQQGTVAKNLSDVFHSDGDPTTVYIGAVAAVVSSVLISVVVNAELKKVLARAKMPKRADESV
jgi:hypothetical protein